MTMRHIYWDMTFYMPPKSSYVEAYNNKITCRTNSGLRVYNTNHVSFYNNNITSEGSGGAGIQIQKEGTYCNMDDIEVYNNTIYRTKLAGIWIFGSGSYSRFLDKCPCSP